MDKELEKLLTGDLLKAPDDFTHRVMQQVNWLPLPVRHAGLLEKLQKLALIAGGIVGATQLAAFMFGLWAASSAG